MHPIQTLARPQSGRNGLFRMPMLKGLALAGVALALLCACGSEARKTADPSPLADCEPGDGPRNALCGWIPVYEDRSAASGRQIDLRVVVYPALSRDRQPDPLFVLAGGPGQGAAQLSPLVVSSLGDVRRERDIVFVDQRGTGLSNGLPCDQDTDDLSAFPQRRPRCRHVLELPRGIRGRPALLHHPFGHGRSRRGQGRPWL